VRPGSVLAEKVKIGNFVEVKNTTIGRNSKINHLSYIGDASIGQEVNIGAGTITCNYDGKRKHKTIIHDRVLIGSDTQLIAPVTIGEDVTIGAGTTVVRDIPPKHLVHNRVEYRSVPDWSMDKELE
jgi:bifunctional UDP-N-acetylglucosamine pyrophosphorylase/glucosamine-1-phosphate N-acetyltransferase